MAGPIKPDQVAGAKRELFPEAVWEAFNELIARNLVDSEATFEQKDVVELMVAKGLTRSEIDEKGWLNVEETFEANGWHVEYDKPGFNETGEATFTFKKKRKR